MKKEECKCDSNCCNNSFGVASLVLGIVSLAFSPLLIPPLITAILGIIFGFVQQKRSKSKMAIWGIVLSILAIIVMILFVWQIMVIINGYNKFIEMCMANPSAPGCEAITKVLGGVQ